MWRCPKVLRQTRLPGARIDCLSVHLISTLRPVFRQGSPFFCSVGLAERTQYEIDRFRLLYGKFFLLDASSGALHTPVRKRAS
jgi:hypothetical protein